VSKRRPYIYQDREWAEIARIQEKVDVQGDEVPLSHLDRPYLYGNDEDDNYQPYETDWPYPPPGIGPWPTDPVPIPGPCDSEGGCGFVTLVSVPETVECEDSYHFNTIHVVHGCEPARFEDAFLVWSLHGPGTLTPTGVGATYQAPECCDGDEVTVCVSSIAGDCADCRTFHLECAACCSDEMVITGADTANPNSIWGGAIDPPCPGAECTVTNNSGCPMACEVNSDGSSVTVPVGAKNCGSFTVTVTEDTSTPQKQEDNCPGESATKTVRINGNGAWWKLCGGGSAFLCNGPFCGCTYEDGERRWRIWIGAGIFCTDQMTRACFDAWNPTYPAPPSHPGNIVWGPATFRADDCDTNGPCAGHQLFGVSLFYWANPDCECI
jgi:hypothetical protein